MVLRADCVSLCVGLTGGIASGKSTVAKTFAKRGIPIIDADQVARDVVKPGSAGIRTVIDFFGDEFLLPDGNLNRRKMRELVFATPEKRKILEQILHPLIRDELKSWRNTLSPPYGILMAPIMREAGFDQLTDRILVVDVAREIQVQRLMARDEINQKLAEQMLGAQSSREERLSIANDVIDNSHGIDAIEPQVASLHEIYTTYSRQHTGH